MSFDSLIDKKSLLTVFITGLVTFLLYKIEQHQKKRNAARIILQEIRRAEDVISEYKKWRDLQIYSTFVSANSWSDNIHYFVGDLDNDELDKISDLYTLCVHLDFLLLKITDTQFELSAQPLKDLFNKKDATTQDASVDSKKPEANLPKEANKLVNIPVPGANMLAVAGGWTPIYESDIGRKLRSIANSNYFVYLMKKLFN